MTLDPTHEHTYLAAMRRDMAIRDSRCTCCVSILDDTGTPRDRPATWQWTWPGGRTALLCDECCATWWANVGGAPHLGPHTCRAITSASTP